MGRTRPKKLTSKASIPVVREHEIDALDEDIQSSLQQIETGVEKAEESVSPPSLSRDIIAKMTRDFHPNIKWPMLTPDRV
jgi:hypothetical protein